MGLPASQEELESCSTADVELVLVPAERVLEVWSVAGPLIDKVAINTPKLSLEDIPALVGDGTYQLWLLYAPDDGDTGVVLAAILTDLQVFYTGWKIMRILVLGGSDMHRWMNMLCRLEDWARMQGCDALEICGRRGWYHVLPDDYDLKEYVYVKGLKDG